MQENKFIRNLTLSNKTIKGNRAKLIAEDAEEAQNTLLRNLKKELRDLRRKRESLEDMYPESEFSLRVTKENFNPVTWANELQAAKVAISMKEVEVKLAEETYNDWFGSNKEEVETSNVEQD